MNADPPNWLKDWQGDGIIARIETVNMARTLRRLALPTVDVRCRRRVAGIPWVDTDDRQVVQMAFDHLRERGFRRIAYCGFRGANYSSKRKQALLDHLDQYDLDLQIYETSGPHHPTTPDAEIEGMLDETGLAQWLSSLEKPTGVIASNDIRAQQILVVCRQRGISVPDEIAVIGVDNDDVVCEICDPPLSSIQPDTELAGFRAAALLQELMDGADPPDTTLMIPPRGVACRRSTDAMAIDDPQAATAYRIIRESACSGLSVSDVVRQVGLSRRALERRLKKRFGRTPGELIDTFRLRRVRELLEETELTLEQIAGQTGFRYVEHLSVFFKNQTGMPPGRYRKQHRTAVR